MSEGNDNHIQNKKFDINDLICYFITDMPKTICPKCKGQFKEFKHKDSGVIFDLCQLCYAMWFDKDEFWTLLQNKKAKNQFKKKGLINKKRTKFNCPKCRVPHIFLDQGTLPMTTVEVEHCVLCESFLFDGKEYRQSKIEIDENTKNLKSVIDQNNLKEIKEDDFSTRLFKKRLKNLNSEVYELTSSITRPNASQSVESFFSRIGKAFQLILKEPEIILFSLLQALAICMAYLLWVQMLDWIPEEVWKSTENSDDGSVVDIVLIAWSFVCVGLAALPIGFFTACMGAVHILNSHGRESTILRCFKFVFPKIWPIWIFSWVDGWITIKRIVDRLPGDNKKTPTQKAIAEAMYYAWKVGTIGVIPGLVTSKNTWQACKNSFGFLKRKTIDILLIRGGYSAVSWIVGILAYIGAVFTMMALDINREEIYSKIYVIYFYMAFPIFIAVGFLHIFIRPFYILSLFDLYSDYMIETKQKIVAPQRRVLAQTAIWAFTFLIILVIFVFLFREELGIMKMLATPYGEIN